MTWPAHPKRTGNHVFLAEQLLKAFLSVEVLGDQVVPGESGNGAQAELAMFGLGREFEHRQVVIRARR
mgnify:CR=1 FL=1